MIVIKRMISILSLILVSFTLFVLLRLENRWLHTSGEFAIRELRIKGNELLTREDVLSVTAVIESQNIWEVDLKLVEARLLENPFIEMVYAQRHLPDVLEIRIQEKEPIALLNFQGKFYCIDRKGLILPSKPGKLYNMPVISGKFEGGVKVGSPAKGRLIRKGLDFLILVINDRPEVYDQISEIVLDSDGGMNLFTSQNGITVRMGEGREIQKIRYLEAALKQIQNDPDRSRIRYIDLRFQGQVVIGMRA